jgi:hypothetical protein
MIEKVTQGSRRTVDFSLPMGTNDPTSVRKIIATMKKIMESIPGLARVTVTVNGRAGLKGNDDCGPL